MNRYCLYKGKQYFIDTDIAECANLRLCDVAKMCKRYSDHTTIWLDNKEHTIITLASTIDLMAPYFSPEGYLSLFSELSSSCNVYITEFNTYKKIIRYYLSVASKNPDYGFLRDLFYFASVGYSSGEIIVDRLKNFQPNLGMYTPTGKDVTAKNFLSQDELHKCIRFNVMAYSYLKMINPTTEETFWECLDNLLRFLQIDKSKMKIVPTKILDSILAEHLYKTKIDDYIIVQIKNVEIADKEL